jgi:hypothetical protein
MVPFGMVPFGMVPFGMVPFGMVSSFAFIMHPCNGLPPFADPALPRQCGASDNINGHIREYSPKCIDFNTGTKGQTSKSGWRLNSHPGVSIDNQSPSEDFSGHYTQNSALAA